MKRQIIFLFYLFYCFGSITYGQVGTTGDHNIDDGSGNKCTGFNASLTITKSLSSFPDQTVEAVILDCPENYNYSININDVCPAEDGIFCDTERRVDIKFNNEVIHQHFISLNNNVTDFTYSGNFSELNLDNLGTPGTGYFTVWIYERCINSISINNDFEVSEYPKYLTFQLVSSNENQLYSTYAWDYADTYVHDAECLWGDVKLCCNSISTVKIEGSAKVINTITNTSSGSISVSSKLSISTQIPGFQSSTGLNTQVSLGVSASELISNSESIVISSKLDGEPGVCKTIGLQALSSAFIETNYIPKCDGPDEFHSSQKFYIPTSVQYTECTAPPNNDCSDLSNDISIQKGRNLLPSECNGFINLSISGSEDLTIGWTGPGGFQANTFSIDNLEIGTYTYLITNDCCDEISGEVVLCDDNLDIGPWEYDESNQQYCRVIICNSFDSGFRGNQNTGCETVECVTPDEVVHVYEDMLCKTEHYYQGSLLGEIINTNTSEDITYDEFNQNCVKTIYCEGTIAESIIDVPTYGSWQFNFANEMCERAIICFDQEIQGVKNSKEPDIEEIYNEITGLCSRVAYCDFIPINLPPEPPFFSSQYTWTEWGGCIRNVQCSFDSEITTVQGMESFFNWTVNSSTGMCESSVTCDNIPVFGAVHSSVPNSVGSWEWSSSRPYTEQCRRKFFCGQYNTEVFDFASPTFIPTGSNCTGTDLPAYYVYCSGQNTGEVTCFQGDDNPDDQIVGGGNNRKDKRIFPNPFNNQLVVQGVDLEFGDFTVQLINSKGQIIRNEVLDSYQLDTSDLPSGLYFIAIFNQGQLDFTAKVTKH